jgi:hypothetical protein
MPPQLVVHPPRQFGEPTQVIFNLLRADRLPSITEQLQTIKNESLLRPPGIPVSIGELPRVHIKGKEYIRESLIAGKRGRVTIIEPSRHELAYDARHAQTSPYSVNTTSWFANLLFFLFSLV